MPQPAPASPTQLSIDDLCVWRGERCLIDGLSFAVDIGELLWLRGDNGVGKTSLLRAICGLPFFVLATQNPIELEGTYPLPEAQLDRFLFNVLLDYLSAEDEVDVVNRTTTRMDLPEVNACTTPEQIVKFQWLIRQVPVSDAVARYAVDLVPATRPHDPNASAMVKKYVQYGASVRATQFVTLAAKARALMQGRYHVMHEDIAALALPVMRHRVLTNYFAESDGVDTDKVLTDLVKHVGGEHRQARVG